VEEDTLRRTLAALHCFQNFLCILYCNKMWNLSEEIRRTKERFPRHISCTDMLRCYSLFQKGHQGKHLFSSAEEWLCILDLCTEATPICYGIHKQRTEVPPDVLFQSSSSSLLFCRCHHVSIPCFLLQKLLARNPLRIFIQLSIRNLTLYLGIQFNVVCFQSIQHKMHSLDMKPNSHLNPRVREQ